MDYSPNNRLVLRKNNNDMRLFTLLFFYCTIISGSMGQTAPQNGGEQYRPAFHFTPSQQWMNDPNGLVYFEGEYHLFYQYHPASNVWGPMHWGHAVSTDMVQWQHLPIALYPDSLGLIFSGSCVVDWNNSSGFGQNGKPPLVAIFTHHDMAGEQSGRTDFQYQSLAYSLDRGRTWTKYKGNPVIPNTQKIKDFRDPKVIWDKSSKQWIMVFAAQDHVKIWGSPNLRDWKHLSDFGKAYGCHKGVWECPDLFPITIEGTNEQRWILLQSLNPGAPNGGSGTQYFVGKFDGEQFTPDPDCAAKVRDGNALWLDWGRDNYAGVTFSDIPATDGRRLFIGWMSNWDYARDVPTYNWRSATTLPRSLHLSRTTKGGLELSSWPVAELAKLRGKRAHRFHSKTLNKPLKINKKGLRPSQCEVELEYTPASGESKVWLELSNAGGGRYVVGYDHQTQQFFSDRTLVADKACTPNFASKIHYAPRQSDAATVKMRLFFDRASCELFADDGSTVLTDIFFPDAAFTQLRVLGAGGGRVKGVAWSLR